MKLINNTPVLIKANHTNIQHHLITTMIDVVLTYNCDVSIKERMINKLNTNTYLDLIILDGNNLNKEAILNLQNRLEGPSLEEIGLKFYVIYNIDKTSNIIQNSLLKFIENPPKNVYAFFSCSDQNKILPTILSRLMFFEISDDSTPYTCKNKEWIKYDNQLINYFKADQFVQDFLVSDNAKKILWFADNFNTSKDYKKLWDEFKSFSYKEIDFIFELLLSFNHDDLTKTIYDIRPDIELNLNKTLIFDRLMFSRKD